MNEQAHPDEYLRKQAWDYFQVHASQRLTTFNFYIVISSLITTALFATLQKDYRVPQVGAVPGLFLIFFSFVFWKLDERNRELVRIGEAALRSFESASEPKDDSQEPHVAKVFSREEHETNQKRLQARLAPWNRFFSYSACFRWIFWGFSLVGAIGALVALST
jgi:hypothetical protein